MKKPCGVYRFAVAAKNLSLLFLTRSVRYRMGRGALPSAMAAVNTKPLNSAATADKSEAAAGVL